jgi:phospholipase C
MSDLIRNWSRSFFSALAASYLGACGVSTGAESIVTPAVLTSTTTPIKHLIIVVGENRGFDNVFGTYDPPDRKQSVWNLLSQGIVTKLGQPGRNVAQARQQQAVDNDLFQLAPRRTGAPKFLPQPSTTLNALPGSPCQLALILTIKGDNPGNADFCNDAGLLPDDQNLLRTGGTGQPFYFTIQVGSASALLSPKLQAPATAAAPQQTITLYPVPDCRYPANLPNAPYLLVGGWTPTNCTPFDLDGFTLTPRTTTFQDNTGDPVHRFFQMWQQNDCSLAGITLSNPSGCRHDLYTWVATSVGWALTKDGQPPTDPQSTFQGGIPMGFYNMAAGEYPYFKSLAQSYAISDNYHQPVMGGTGANSQFMVTGDVYYYTDSDGKASQTPPAYLIENPNPKSGSNNFYVQAGLGPDPGNTSVGGLVNCSDLRQPGVGAIMNYIRSLPYRPFRNGNCDQGIFYQVDNEYPYYDHLGNVIQQGNEFSAGPAFSIGPQTLPTIGEALSAKNISWKYYGEGFNQANSLPLANQYYCAICNGFQFSRNIMTGPLKSNLQDLPNFYNDVSSGALPAVSFVKPDVLLDSHPGTSTPPLFEGFVENVIESVKKNPLIWKDTAILITFDESGGYYDSGYIQPIDFFGDGPRTVMIAVSPYAKTGFVDHTYGDHASILKFIERNWKLQPLSARSRDNLPNPISLPLIAPYFPLNSPAVGDLMGMFDFLAPPHP